MSDIGNPALYCVRQVVDKSGSSSRLRLLRHDSCKEEHTVFVPFITTLRNSIQVLNFTDHHLFTSESADFWEKYFSRNDNELKYVLEGFERFPGFKAWFDSDACDFPRVLSLPLFGFCGLVYAHNVVEYLNPRNLTAVYTFLTQHGEFGDRPEDHEAATRILKHRQRVQLFDYVPRHRRSVFER